MPCGLTPVYFSISYYSFSCLVVMLLRPYECRFWNFGEAQSHRKHSGLSFASFLFYPIFCTVPWVLGTGVVLWIYLFTLGYITPFLLVVAFCNGLQDGGCSSGKYTLTVTNTSNWILDPLKGKRAWYWIPNQLSGTSEVMGLGKESIVTTLINQYKP